MSRREQPRIFPAEKNAMNDRRIIRVHIPAEVERQQRCARNIPDLFLVYLALSFGKNGFRIARLARMKTRQWVTVILRPAKGTGPERRNNIRMFTFFLLLSLTHFVHPHCTGGDDSIVSFSWFGSYVFTLPVYHASISVSIFICNLIINLLVFIIDKIIVI